MKLIKSILLVLLFMMSATGPALAAEVLEGEASYYSDKLDGNKTASGEIYKKD